MGLNGFIIKKIIKILKRKNPESRLGFAQPIQPNLGDIFNFDLFFEYETIEIYACSFLSLIILAVGTVSK